ncbi:MAG: cytochrome b/b6 domain-containing protein [Granulosicoccus sp.]|nr:cytochrome b/b6 domain-containing protein [Granulosicoccus sp.]
MPIRIWHWLLVVSVVAGWLLGYYRDFSIMQWHFYAGYMTGGLLVIRLLLGLFGPSSLRFSSLGFSWQQLKNYVSHFLRRAPSGVAGHNPLGSLSVIAMLLALSVQVITGLFSEDDALFYEGPLASSVSSAVRLKLISIHHFSASALLWLVGLHVGAILFYLIWKKENLVIAMITGNKLVRKNDR